MEKLKTIGSILLILLLFPYVCVMLAGRSPEGPGTGTLMADAGEESGVLEQWVLEILPAQMPVTYELEALKAQAVLIRSNLAFCLQEEGMEPEELKPEALDRWKLLHYSLAELMEIWGDTLFDEYYDKICRAVQETKGLVLTYEGRYVDLPYHAVSAGRTRDGAQLGEEYSYLKAVECPGDLEAENFLQLVRLEISGQQDYGNEAEAGSESESGDGLEIVSRDEAEYVTEIRQGEKSLMGEEFRQKYDLASSCFTLQEQENGWIVTTKGLGHGFGLSMYQARLQACQGKTFLEILEYFYTGMECISFS